MRDDFRLWHLLRWASAQQRPLVLLRFGVPPYRGRGRRPSQPCLYRVGDPQGLRVRAVGAAQHSPGQHFVCRELRVVKPRGRAAFLVPVDVVPLPPLAVQLALALEDAR